MGFLLNLQFCDKKNVNIFLEFPTKGRIIKRTRKKKPRIYGLWFATKEKSSKKSEFSKTYIFFSREKVKLQISKKSTIPAISFLYGNEKNNKDYKFTRGPFIYFSLKEILYFYDYAAIARSKTKEKLYNSNRYIVFS